MALVKVPDLSSDGLLYPYPERSIVNAGCSVPRWVPNMSLFGLLTFCAQTHIGVDTLGNRILKQRLGTRTQLRKMQVMFVTTRIRGLCSYVYRVLSSSTPYVGLEQIVFNYCIVGKL